MQLLSIWNIHQINVFSFPVCKTCIMKHYIIDMQKKKKKRKLCLCWTSGTAAMMQCSCCLLCEVWYTTTQKDLLPNSLLMKNCAKTCISISSHAQRLEQHQTTQSHKYCITKVSLKSMNSHPFRDSLTAVYLTLLWVTDKFSHRILYIWNWIKYW